MTDIVDRLRKGFNWSLADEAAAEIERLRAEIVGKDRALLFSFHEASAQLRLFDQIEKLRLENAELRRNKTLPA